MTQEEFIENRTRLHMLHAAQIANLETEYAKSNQKYKIGDTIYNRNCEAIIIDSVQYGKMFGTSLPSAIYSGYMLTKKGELRKDKSRMSVFQANIV